VWTWRFCFIAHSLNADNCVVIVSVFNLDRWAGSPDNQWVIKLKNVKAGKHDAEIASSDAIKPLTKQKRNKTRKKLSPEELEIQIRRKTGGGSKAVRHTRPN
jgi:hypothetical protein